MNNVEFDEFLKVKLENLKNLLSIKNEEYSANNDRFHNFKRAAQIANITPEKALYGFLLKHLTSMNDIVDDIDNGKYPSINKLEEKCSDVVCYYILLEALIKENKKD